RIILTNDNEVSGWSNAEQRNPLYVERSLQELLQSGIPREAVDILFAPIYNTRDEALLLQAYAKQQHIQSMLIVTSGYHSRRAYRTFQHFVGAQGIDVGINPVATGIQTPEPAVWWLYRSGWNLVPGEYLKLIYYHVRA